MVAVFTVLVVLTCSLIVVQVATVGLTMTGLSKDLAQFQALSAFTGSGFTTKESEEIVNHPLRRRIVMHLMLLGNAGIVIAISSLMLSFLGTTDSGTTDSNGNWTSVWWYRLLVLTEGVLVLWIVANSQYVERATWRINQWALSRWGHIAVQDYTRLLRLSRSYVVWEMQVQDDNWLAGQTLGGSALSQEGILVLGIERANGDYVGAPRGRTLIEPGDQLIVYGQQVALDDLDKREPGMLGNIHHVMAVTRQLDVLEDESKLSDHESPDSS